MQTMKVMAVLGASFILVLPAYAQTQPGPFGGRGTLESQEVYRAPEVFVLKSEITKQENRHVEGLATFWNTEDAIVGGLTYKLELLGKLDDPIGSDPIVADNAPVYDSLFAKESFTLIPKEKREISFTYTAPSQLPAGEYRLEITVSTTRGRTMGWYDMPVTFTGGRQEIIDMRPAHIIVPEYSEPEFEPGSGPNVSVGKQLKITAQVHSKVTMSAVPVFDIYRFNNAREKVASLRGRVVRVGTDIQLITLPVTPASTAGVYVGILSMRDQNTNDQISNIGEYRYVVRGNDADVLHVRMNASGFEKGSTLRSVIDYAGAADAEISGEGTITVEVVDAQGIAGVMQAQSVTLSDQIRSGTSALTLNRSLHKDFKILVRIADQGGRELVVSEIPFSFTDTQIKKLGTARMVSRVILYGGALCIIVGAVFIWKSRQGQNRKKQKRK